MNRKTFRNLTLTGVLTALVFVVARFLPAIPLGINAYVNLGDTVIYLSVLVLPTPYAIAAGAIGAALSDLTFGAVLWVIPTLLVKALIVLTAKGLCKVSKHHDLMISLCGVVGVIGYYLAEVVLIRFFIVSDQMTWAAGVVGSAASIWGNVVQGLGSGILFYAFAKVLRRIPAIKKYLVL